MDASTLNAAYSKKLAQTNESLKAEKKKISLLAYSRFLLFLCFVFSLWPVFKYEQYWFIAPATVFIVIFFVLVKKQAQAERTARFLEMLIKIVQAELQGLAQNFSGFDNGNTFINFDHPYTFDLDVFGEGSLYQQMNRTSSDMGKKKLAEWLENSLLQGNAIQQKQEAAKELAQKKDFRLHFLAKGLLHPFTAKDKLSLTNWLKSADKLTFNPFINTLLIILPVLTASAIVAWAAGYIPYGVPTAFASVNLYWVYSKVKAVNEIHRQLNSKYKTVQNLAEQLQLFEEENFESGVLQELKAKLKGNEKTAGEAIEQLGGIMQSFDARLNVFGAFLFNSVMLFDLQMTKRLYTWKKQFGPAATGWLDVLSEAEAYNSLGTYVYNHPGFVFPGVVENQNTWQITEMAHPLMAYGKSVANSFELSGKGKFVIVTGSNMSGKSTFLRTIGLNMVLAQMGAPVYAKTFAFSPVDIFTSMRINDSLQQNESYFYAEIKRLNRITKKAAEQKPMLILLDEILRGTNSTDKHTGSEALMLKLTELNATGILATHDLSLGKMAENFPGRFVNKCFESVIENNELYFDYKMRDGVCQNLNAVFLMKKMGIM